MVKKVECSLLNVDYQWVSASFCSTCICCVFLFMCKMYLHIKILLDVCPSGYISEGWMTQSNILSQILTEIGKL